MVNPHQVEKNPEWGTLEYLRDALSKLVDDYGLQNTLDELSSACQEKADHLNKEWQDYVGGVTWTHYADCVREVSFHLFQKRR